MKQQLTRILFLSLASCTLIACNADKKDNQDSIEISADLRGDSTAIATIDGTNIYKTEFAGYVKTRANQSLDDLTPAVQDRLLEEYIQLELLSRTGKMKGLNKTNDYKIGVNNLSKNLLAQAVLEMDDANNPITDDMVMAEYNKQKPQLEQPSFKARHILLKTEDEAKAIIAQLDKGGDFVEIAKEKSTGPSGSNGGDLGWFTADRMVKPFSDATAALEVGKYSKTPVQTQFGFHVILKEEQKASEAPPLENLRPRLEQQIKQERVQAFLKNLKDTAKIEKFIEKDDVTEAPKTESVKEDPAVK